MALAAGVAWLAATVCLPVRAPAAPAVSGTISAATGAVRVNGQQTKIVPGRPCELSRGDLFDTQDASATWRSASGDEVQLEPKTAARDEGIEDGVSALFVRWGVAGAQISDKTLVGCAAGWASVEKDAKARVIVEVPKVRAAQEAHFRATEGTAWIRYDTYSVGLAQGLGATLSVDPRDRGVLWFRTSQQNDGDVLVRKAVPAGTILAIVPRGAIGMCSEVPGDVTRVMNDRNSVQTAKLRVVAWFKAKSPYSVPVPPGCIAAIDGSGTAPATTSAPAPAPPPRGDQPGDRPLAGVVQVAKIDRSEDGGVTYTVENLSGKAQPALVGRVWFQFAPPTGGAIVIQSDVDSSGASELPLAAEEKAGLVTAANPRPGTIPLSTCLEVSEDPPIATLARTKDQPGTGSKLLVGALECVSISDEDDVHAGKLSVEMENVSAGALSGLEANVAFRDVMDTGRTVSETAWTPVPDAAPGGRARIDFDISTLGRVGRFAMVVRVRRR